MPAALPQVQVADQAVAATLVALATQRPALIKPLQTARTAPGQVYVVPRFADGRTRKAILERAQRVAQTFGLVAQVTPGPGGRLVLSFVPPLTARVQEKAEGFLDGPFGPLALIAAGVGVALGASEISKRVRGRGGFNSDFDGTAWAQEQLGSFNDDDFDDDDDFDAEEWVTEQFGSAAAAQEALGTDGWGW